MEPRRTNVASGAKWEAVVGYSRLVRAGEHVYVTGTTAWLPGGGHAGDGDAGAQGSSSARSSRRRPRVEVNRLIEDRTVVQIEADAVFGARG